MSIWGIPALNFMDAQFYGGPMFTVILIWLNGCGICMIIMLIYINISILQF